VVTWCEYEALRDHLKRAIDHSADKLDGDINAVKTQLGNTDNTVNTIQTQVTDIQVSMARLEATVTRLISVYAQENQQYADADSIGDNGEVVNGANQGRGRGFLNRGYCFHPVGIPRPCQGAP
jgi:septal ring factor EnvC (AmiA/AmiB activator)